MGRFEIVCLAIDVLEFVAEMPGIEQDHFVGELFEEGVGPVNERFVCDRSGDLLVCDQGVRRLQGILNPVQHGTVGSLGSLVKKAKVHPRLFVTLKIGLAERHGVKALFLDDQAGRIDSKLLELACQFSAEDIIPDDAYDLNCGRLKGGEIGHDV